MLSLGRAGSPDPTLQLDPFWRLAVSSGLPTITVERNSEGAVSAILLSLSTEGTQATYRVPITRNDEGAITGIGPAEVQ